MSSRLSRRQFVRGSLALGTALSIPVDALGGPRSPNEKLNIAMIGTANQARFSIDNVRQENIVAVCDVDETYLDKAVADFPTAAKYTDWRKMLDRKDIEAVVVATPDHHHAPATLAALQTGRHVYCEKPLTHTVEEARKVIEATKKYKRATQMGTQIHAGNNYRRVVEIVRSGAIGRIGEVHCWVGTVWSGFGRPDVNPPCPATMHWDTWLGAAPERPYNPAYHPAAWRGWWDFGGGGMADMACHHMDLPFWALDLRDVKSVEATGSPYSSETAAKWIVAKYELGGVRGPGPGPGGIAEPIVKLTWYDGGKRPHYFDEGTLPSWGNGTLFVGSKGMLLADYDRYKLLPEKDFASYQPPTKSIPDSIGHHKEWIRACKTGEPTTCSFDYSGVLTEAVLLGTVAYKTGKRLEWDAANLKCTNCPEADMYLRKTYRTGWAI